MQIFTSFAGKEAEEPLGIHLADFAGWEGVSWEE